MAELNTPVLIGPVPLLYVRSISISEGYQIERIAGSSFSQAIAPTTKTIAIEAMLLGPDRLRLKKELEALAIVSRVLAAAAPALKVTSIPVVSGFTISLDMQITDLRFNQSVQKRDVIDVSMTLRHVPPRNLNAAGAFGSRVTVGESVSRSESLYDLSEAMDAIGNAPDSGPADETALNAIATALERFNRRAVRWPAHVTVRQIRALIAELRRLRP